MESRPEAVSRKHGTKRPADDGLEEQQRLSKRFNLLNLDRPGSKLWIAPPTTTHHPSHPPLPQPQPQPTSTSHHNGDPQTTPHDYNNNSNNDDDDDDDRMHLEDTKTTLYIHNLDAELAAITAAEEASRPPPAKPHLVFIPDIERHLNRVPAHLLQDATAIRPTESSSWPAESLWNPQSPGGGELVLYSVPSSLSVPLERDSVRRAILESRARAREKQEHQHEQVVMPAPAVTQQEKRGEHGQHREIFEAADEDGDAMDIG